MFHSPPARWLALLSLAAASAAMAQSTPSDVPPLQHDHAQHHAQDHRTPASLPYASAFDGYRPFADAEPTGWRQANETVAARDPHAGHAMPMPGMSNMPGMAHGKDSR